MFTKISYSGDHLQARIRGNERYDINSYWTLINGPLGRILAILCTLRIHNKTYLNRLTKVT